MLLRSLLAALIIVACTAGASSTAALLKIDELLPPILGPEVIPEVQVDPAGSGKPQTILLMGSDKRFRDGDDDPPRSDTLMLVRIDPKQRATTLLSIPRDLRVDIPGHGRAKINDAYGLGGPELTTATIKALTGLEVNHVANLNFKGFRQVVNHFDCFYADVDRRYFHSNVGVAPSERYDAIDIEPGYQRLCGIDALDYVRFRHTDSDIVRAARQQDFLRAAKDQVSTSRVVDDLGGLAKLIARATQTDRDLRTTTGFLRFAKAALRSADNPVRQVPFPATFREEGDGEEKVSYVEASPGEIADAVEKFMTGGGAAAKAPVVAKKASRRGSVRAAEMVEARARAAELVAGSERAAELAFPLRFPSHLTQQGRYDEPLRVYRLRDRTGTLHQAYRFVVAENRVDGQFYGVQGTTWRTPPLLADPSAVRRVKGRRLELFRSGGRLRYVAWRTDTAVYWISNTLGLKLSNAEMLALAGSLTTAK